MSGVNGKNMQYKVLVFDTWGREIAHFMGVPLLRAVRTTPDKPHTVEGILPGPVTDLGIGYRVRVIVGEDVFVDANVTAIRPHWGDARRLILDHYVNFHEIIEFSAESDALPGNTAVSQGYTNRTVSQIVKDVINRALGPIHYRVDHTAYPDGAEREYQKFLARKTTENELGIGGITAGQWVGADRMDLTGAYAKDGDTVAGIVVDGAAWPDLRLILIDSEETSRNNHAIGRHPEVADWTDARYDVSGYKLKADAAKAFLQDLIDTNGIDYIELNPHRDATGAFDDRIDAYGRYLGLVFGGGECFNAALVEQGHADVYLYEDGKYLVPGLELKDFFSYTGEFAGSIQDSLQTLAEYDVENGALEVIAALCYGADGFGFTVDLDNAVEFRRIDRADTVLFFDPLLHAVTLGAESAGIINAIYLSGNPNTTPLSTSYFNGDSIDEFGFRAGVINYFSVSRAEDADLFGEGLLKDLAYPTPTGEIEFIRGNASINVGDVLELRGAPLRRLDPELAGEWDGRFSGRIVGRVSEVRHEFRGARVSTFVRLTSPFRSVEDPIGFMLRSQPAPETLFQFRLDEATVGLDLGYHLD